MRVDDRAERAVEARLDGRARQLADLQLLTDPLEDQDVRVDRHADGQRDAGDTRQRQGGAEGGHAREEDEKVQDERDVGDHPGEPVVDHHEDEDHHRRGEDRDHPLADRVGAERRPDGPFLQDRHRGGEGALAQHDGEVACLVDRELAGDHGAAARDALVDPRRRIHAAVEDDREVAADVLLGDVAEALRAARAERDGHLPVPG